MDIFSLLMLSEMVCKITKYLSEMLFLVEL